MRVGIFFGGPSREREISFAGGRTVYDNLNKALFEPVPIFVDSLKNLILLDWQYVYKGTIRDFYPPLGHVPDSPNNFQIYIESLAGLDDDELRHMIGKVGTLILPYELPGYMDFAFLAMHGSYGEDGQIQGILESLNIPYSGSGIMPSSIGMNKAFQKKALEHFPLATPKYHIVTRSQWLHHHDKVGLYAQVKEKVGEKLVIKPSNQGSSIGVSIVSEDSFGAFERGVDKALFIKHLEPLDWIDLDDENKVSFVRDLADIREGLGMPVFAGHADNEGEVVIFHPEELLKYIEQYFDENQEPLRLMAMDAESEVVVEEFISGKEFSCIVVRNEDGKAVALPPTEIVKGKEVFDYRSKYLAGLSRKVTPIEVDDDTLARIRKDCLQLFDFFGFHVYARIDGFIREDGTIFLNDPNTTSGMLPSSFFFHQAAEIGLNPSQFLSYIIRTSLAERQCQQPMSLDIKLTLDELDNDLIILKTQAQEKQRIGVILGGYSSERHISVESGRNIYEKLSSSEKYEPIPIFLTGNDEHFDIYQIPVNLMLKDNADDIRDKVLNYKRHPLIEQIRQECSAITEKYTDDTMTFQPRKLNFYELDELVDGVFIALHGRPGEDGALQAILEQHGIPYNGSGVESSNTTINKYETNQFLKKHGFLVADQVLVFKEDYEKDNDGTITKLLSELKFPLIAKPVDDGCSSAVKKIKNIDELKAFFTQLFRNTDALEPESARVLKLKVKEEFSRKDVALIESFIDRQGAKYFLEVTGGMLTHYNEGGQQEVTYEVFEPSEALAGGEVLSLEEKFLAGEGQNLTPARFGRNQEEYDHISAKVKADLGKVAKLLHVEGYCRIDAFVRVTDSMDVQTIIIEVNSLPGMTPATCIFHQAAINGYKPYDFIDGILDFSFKRNRVERSN
jgi:D-alanine-D-alanine ligase